MKTNLSAYVILNIVCLQMVIALIIDMYKKIAKSNDSTESKGGTEDGSSQRKSVLDLARGRSLRKSESFGSSTLLSASTDELTELPVFDHYDKGDEITLTKTYDGVIDGILLEEGTKVEFMEKTSNHILVAQGGQVLGYVPKEYFIEPKCTPKVTVPELPPEVPERRSTERGIKVKKQKWTVQVQGMSFKPKFGTTKVLSFKFYFVCNIVPAITECSQVLFVYLKYFLPHI